MTMSATFTESFDAYRREVAVAPDDSIKLGIIRELAYSASRLWIPAGLAKPDAVDTITEIAICNGIGDTIGTDNLQRVIGEEMDRGAADREILEPPRNRAKKNGKDHITALRIMSKAEFLGGFVPPDFLIDGLMQRRFVYALTGQTGHAKSAIALLISELVSSDIPNAMLGTHKVARGQVVYFVGENPDDIRMRVIGADSQRPADSNPLGDRIVFIPGVFNIDEMFGTLERELKKRGTFDLIVVDTSAAYFLGNEELSNTQMGAHARMLRKLTTLPGGPCVLVLCHPIKHVIEPSQLLPRGGGAFLAEMDGNLTSWKHDDVMIDLHHNKMRGPGFEPMGFRLERILTPSLIDARGNMIPTVRAVPVSQTEEDKQVNKVRNDEDLLLAKMLGHPQGSMSDLADACGWKNSAGEALKAKVQRALSRLEKAKLVKSNRGQWLLTETGKDTARKTALKLEQQLENEKQSLLSF